MNLSQDRMAKKEQKKKQTQEKKKAKKRRKQKKEKFRQELLESLTLGQLWSSAKGSGHTMARKCRNFVAIATMPT